MPEYQNNAGLLYSITADRSRSTTPLNTIVMFVPQQEVSLQTAHFIYILLALIIHKDISTTLPIFCGAVAFISMLQRL